QRKGGPGQDLPRRPQGAEPGGAMGRRTPPDVGAQPGPAGRLSRSNQARGSSLMPRSITHASFTITRNWTHAPQRVFEAFAKEEAKAKWFAGPPGFEQHEKSFD